MPWFCPRCRMELDPVGEVCPQHGLHGVTEQALERADDAPLLGYVLDGRFALIDYLGGGGMGAVYQGRQLSLDRIVAIKVMHASLTATREDRKRFEEEARALSLLQSAHAVTLYDFGVVRDGPLAHMAFMVLEFVEGETLAHRARGGVLAPEVVAALLDDVADALDEAHAHGIVHRDLKPANIIMSQDHRGNPLVKLIDFGVASFGGRTGLTRTGFSVGTPSYMAPEQFEADGSAALDGRADVYSMGVVAFTVLSGQKPFASNSVLELARMHRTAAPPRLPGADGGGRLAALEAVLHRALAKHPDDRYATMGAFARAFREALAEPVAPVEPVMETVRVAAAMPIIVGPVEAVPTPTESFVGMLEPPTGTTSAVAPSTIRGGRRGGWALGLTLAVCGVGGALLAHWLTAGDPPAPPDQPVVAEVGLEVRGAPGPDADRVVAIEAPALPTDSAPMAAPTVAPAIEVPPIQAPATEAPATEAPAAPATEAPAAPATVARPPAPASAALATERPAPSPPPRRPADPRVGELASAIEAALSRCGCREARRSLGTLSALEGGLKVARRLERRVRTCVVPDVDEVCRDGKVVSP